MEEIFRRQNKKRSCVNSTIQLNPASSKAIPSLEDYPSFQLYLEYSQSIQKEYAQLNEYLNDLQAKIQHVKQDQIGCLGVKHRYYIRKFRKYSEQQQKLLDVFQNLDNTIMQSPQVKQEMKSINFIKMVSEDTQIKLEALKQIVEKAQAKKSQNQLNIKCLKQQLIQCKKKFFEKKRQESKFLKQIQSNKKKKCMQQIQKIMKKIRIQKKDKLQEIRKVFNHLVQIPDKFKMSELSYRVPKKDDYNTLKLEFLQPIKHEDGKMAALIKKSITCSNFTKNSQSYLNNKKKNKITGEKINSNNQPVTSQAKQINTSLLTNQQILKKLTKKQNRSLKQQFREQTSQNVVKLIIQYGKMDEVFNAIDQEKISSLLQCCNMFIKQQSEVKIQQYV